MNTQLQTLIELLTPAVESKTKIRFWYEDKTKFHNDWRIVEPHLIGQHKSSGNIILSAWYLPTEEQFFQGEEQKWGNYLLSNISRIEILNDTFLRTRFGYNKNDTRMSFIYCRTY